MRERARNAIIHSLYFLNSQGRCHMMQQHFHNEGKRSFLCKYYYQPQNLRRSASALSSVSAEWRTQHGRRMVALA